MMDMDDKRIVEGELAGPVGRAVSQWMRKNGIEEPVTVTATVSHPTCYVDETGVSHSGPLVVCNVHILDEEDYYDDEDY